MDCVVGASTGALKSVSLRDSSFSNLIPINGLNPDHHEVTAMSFSTPDQTEFLVAQMDRQLKLYDSVNGAYSQLFDVTGGEGRIRAIHVNRSEHIVSAVDSGLVKVWDKSGEEISSTEVGAGLLTMSSAADGRLAVGGKECPLKILDPETMDVTWESKNVRPDFLGLRVPIWDMSAKFLHDDRHIITTTGLHQMRVYDPRAQRRPVREMEWLDSPIGALSIPPGDNQCIAGNAKGDIGLFDLRKMLLMWKFKGQAGGVRSIDCHPSSPFVASCGLDKFVRIHDINTRKVLNKIYCKVSLNKILMRTNLSVLNEVKEEDEADWGRLEMKELKEDEEEEEEEEGESDGEDVWTKLADDDEPAKKKTKKVEGGESITSEEDTDDEENEPVPKKRKKKEEKKGIAKRKTPPVEEGEPKKKRKVKEHKRKHLTPPASPTKPVKRKKKT